MRVIATLLLVLMSAPGLAASGKATDLDWLTGSWAGPVGDQVLEETWNAPREGTIAALVRMSGSAGTSMMEMIVINEESGSLTLRIQQFSREYEPRFPAPNVLKLTAIGENTATFKADQPEGLQQILYVREDDTLTVTVTLPDGNLFKAELNAR